MSTIESRWFALLIKDVYQKIRLFRSHGLLREVNNKKFVKNIKNKYPTLNPEFIFMYPTYNLRNTEINAIIGINQLKD